MALIRYYIGLVLFLFAILSYAAEPHTPVEKWSAPRLYHTPFDQNFQHHITITRSPWPSQLLHRIYSKNKVYWYGTTRPDTNKNGPWVTNIFVYNENDKLVQIELADHNNYPVKVDWINEKLLHIRVWWGRIIGTDIIYDVEKESPVIKEMVHDGRILFDQRLKSPKPQADYN